MTKKNQEQPEEMASDVLEQTATDQETDNEAATEAVNEQAAAEKLSAELEDLNQKFLRVAADFESAAPIWSGRICFSTATPS